MAVVGGSHRGAGRRPLGSGTAIVLAASAVLTAGSGLAAHGGRDAVRFDLAAAREARRALDDLPRADRLFRAGDYDAAALAFRRVLDRLPDASRAASAAGLLGLETPERYERLRSRVQGNLGVCLLRGRSYAPAVAMLEAAVAGEPGRARHRANLGLALLRSRRYEEARVQLERAASLDGADAKLHLDLARASQGAGDLERARTAAGRALRLSEAAADLEAWGVALEAEELLAEVEWSDGRYERAEPHLRRVLARAPGQVSARQRLVQLLLRTGRAGEARRERARFEADAALMSSIQNTLSGAEGRPERLRWVAYAYERLGLLHLAEVHYRQLLARSPEDHRLRSSLHDLRRRAASKG